MCCSLQISPVLWIINHAYLFHWSPGCKERFEKWQNTGALNHLPLSASDYRCDFRFMRKESLTQAAMSSYRSLSTWKSETVSSRANLFILNFFHSSVLVWVLKVTLSLSTTFFFFLLSLYFSLIFDLAELNERPDQTPFLRRGSGWKPAMFWLSIYSLSAFKASRSPCCRSGSFYGYTWLMEAPIEPLRKRL